jgi:16S rRNA (uracil1498-N3)-methyltransferase
MHRFFVPPAGCRGEAIVLTGDEAHHAARVLRLTAGTPVTVLDGAGTELRCDIVSTDRRQVRLAVRQRMVHPAPACAVTLAAAVPKGRTMEWIVEKATELGAGAILPVLTARTAVRLDDAEGEAKRARWERTAVEAIKQCGNPWLPAVQRPQPLAAALAQTRAAELSLVASLQPGAALPRACFENFRARHRRPPRSVALWIGPEGDFTGGELAALFDAGAQPVTLGNRVLRCETAAVAGLAVVHSELAWAAAEVEASLGPGASPSSGTTA